MIVATHENLRIRIESGVKERWDRVLERKKLTAQDTIDAMVRFFTDEADDVLQSMLAGQIERREDLAKLVLKRLIAKRRKGFDTSRARIGSSAQRQQSEAAGRDSSPAKPG